MVIKNENKLIENNDSTVVVTVTYGRRKSLVLRVVKAAIDAGASHVFVVDNAAKESVKNALNKEIELGHVSVIENPINEGSAKGYALGMAAALQHDARYVLLLDDDNLIGSDYISGLQQVLKMQNDKDQSAAVGFRANHGGGKISLVDQGITLHETNSFLGFHILDLVTKLRKRLRQKAVGTPINRPIYEMNTAPYGGLLLPQSLLRVIGLPDTRFVLYEDDTEFSARIIQNGGKILYVRDQVIVDIDPSWTTADGPRSAIAGWLKGGPDFRLFYTMRNHTYLDLKYRTDFQLVFWINLLIFAGTLLFLAFITGRFGRAKLILSAVVNGLQGKLGWDIRYPLP